MPYVCVVFYHGCVSMWAQQGVCDRFHHLDGSVLMNILTIALNAKACWESSRPPSPQINMEKALLKRDGTPAGRRPPSDRLLAQKIMDLSISFEKVAFCNVLALRC